MFSVCSSKSGDFSGINDCRLIVKTLCESLLGSGSSKGVS